jgi:hypothetical protein
MNWSNSNCEYERIDAKEWTSSLSERKMQTVTYKCVNCGKKAWDARPLQAGLGQYELE